MRGQRTIRAHDAPGAIVHYVRGRLETISTANRFCAAATGRGRAGSGRSVRFYVADGRVEVRSVGCDAYVI